jgi:DNA-binding response OmpR family regulator
MATAHDAPGGNAAAAFGALDWLVKPIDPERLLAMLHARLNGPPAPGESSSAPAVESERPDDG